MLWGLHSRANVVGMREDYNPREPIVGATRKPDGGLDTSRAMTMHVEPNEAAKVESDRNIRTVRNMQEVFDGMHLGQNEQHLSLMLQEQWPLINKYLRNTTVSESGDGIHMAPGIAMLGCAMARSGFGRHEIDTGDKKFDEGQEQVSEKRCKAATDVFNQVLGKIFPQGMSGEVILAGLSIPNGEANRATFEALRTGLSSLYAEGLPHDDLGLLSYQSKIDLLIEQVGDRLGESADINAQLGVDGKITPEESRLYEKDMLTMSIVLKELHNLRWESVRHKYGSHAYDNFSATNLKRIESLERKVKG